MLLFIKMVIEYCQCTDDLPMLITEVLGKLVDMMKVHARKGLCSILKVASPSHSNWIAVFHFVLLCTIVLQLTHLSACAGSRGCGSSRPQDHHCQTSGSVSMCVCVCMCDRTRQCLKECDHTHLSLLCQYGLCLSNTACDVVSDVVWSLGRNEEKVDGIHCAQVYKQDWVVRGAVCERRLPDEPTHMHKCVRACTHTHTTSNR